MSCRAKCVKCPQTSVPTLLCVLQPLLRDAYEKNNKMTEAEARQLLDTCLKVLFYRDARSFNKVGIATWALNMEIINWTVLFSTRTIIVRLSKFTVLSCGWSELSLVFLLQYEVAIVTKDGARIEGPFSSDTDWSIAHMIKYVSTGPDFLLSILLWFQAVECHLLFV